MSKIVSYLSGGLGNQLFQYSTARAFALNHNAELVLDTWSGFVRDFQFRRSYELEKLPINARPANIYERLPVWYYRLKYKNKKLDSNYSIKLFNINFITETESVYSSQLMELPISNYTWLIGYWQSSLYFKNYKSILQKELMPPCPTSNKYKKLGKIARSKESVAIGIRLYEESSNPEFSARDGKIKDKTEIYDAIKKMKKNFADAQFFVFCSYRPKLLEEIGLPDDVIYITPNEGFGDTIDTLWLLSQCKHHLFTNSSYYWWGAWLSELNYSSSKQFILAANNFLNNDTVLSNWDTF